MKVTVTPAHVEDAVRRDSHHCMVADAIKSVKPAAQYVLVDVQTIRYSNPATGQRLTYLTPPRVQQAIIAFDQGKPVKPFTFTLVAPARRRAMTHVKTGDPAATARARAKYRKRKRRSARIGIPSRDREFGVRVLEP